MQQLFKEFTNQFQNESILGYEFVSDSDEKVSSLLRSDALNADFSVFLEDGAGSCIAFWNLADVDIDSRPIVYLSSEGSPFAVIARDFREFLSLLYFGTYAVLELSGYLSYKTIKAAYESAGAKYERAEPTGMSPAELKELKNRLQGEFENYDEVIAWLKSKDIEQPVSAYNIVLNAYLQSPDLNEFLTEKLDDN